MQVDSTTTPAPYKRIVSLRLTQEQRAQLTPYIDVKRGAGAIFAVISSSVDLATGEAFALMQAACMPTQEARAIINQIRKAFGKPALPGVKKARKAK